MSESVPPGKFLELARSLPVIDVRSPKEFAQGHIPGAISIPLFTDEERAIVGTLYTKSGREASVLRGLELVGPKLASFVKALHGQTSSKEILVHCWRGGQRSASMAWLFSQVGYEVAVLEGGYRAYRRFIRAAVPGNAKFIVIGGMTGCGKTELLVALAEKGEQVLDLERIASHKGSAFGALGLTSQPTNEQFENNIYHDWQRLDLSRPVWAEDESRTIGFVNIPDPLFDALKSAPMVLIEQSAEERIRRLVADYGRFSRDELEAPIRKIAEHLGGTRTKTALAALAENRLEEVVSIVLEYYDKAYRFAVERRTGKTLIPMDTGAIDNDIRVEKLIELKSQFLRNESHLS
jgi:tRNA 2-selenouridine synthase